MRSSSIRYAAKTYLDENNSTAVIQLPIDETA